MFRPASGYVEIEPMKDDTLIIDTQKKYEEAGKVITFPIELPSFETNAGTIKLGDIIYFDSIGCKATPEKDGVKHYVVNVADGSIYGIEHVEEKQV